MNILAKKVKVKFWLNQSDCKLHVQNVETGEVKIIYDQMKAALFLNEHNLTPKQLKGKMTGFDVMGLFNKKESLPSLSHR